MLRNFAKFLNGFLLLGVFALAGCQTSSDSNTYAAPVFNGQQLTAPALAPNEAGVLRKAKATPPPAPQTQTAQIDTANSLAAGEKPSPAQESAEQVATVALPLTVPVPKRRTSSPFRVAGESTTDTAVAIASLDPSSGFTPSARPSSRRVKTANGRKLVGPVRTSQRRVASLRKKHGVKYAKRRARWEPLVAKHAKAAGVPVRLAMAVVHVESSFRSKAKGAAGEIGLMQLMPGTARYMGYRGPLRKLYNPNMNLRYGMKYLAKAHRLGKGDLCNVILKYNAGHGAKRMNPISRKYCKRIRRLMKQGV